MPARVYTRAIISQPPVRPEAIALVQSACICTRPSTSLYQVAAGSIRQANYLSLYKKKKGNTSLGKKILEQDSFDIIIQQISCISRDRNSKMKRIVNFNNFPKEFYLVFENFEKGIVKLIRKISFFLRRSILIQELLRNSARKRSRSRKVYKDRNDGLSIRAGLFIRSSSMTLEKERDS